MHMWHTCCYLEVVGGYLEGPTSGWSTEFHTRDSSSVWITTNAVGSAIAGDTNRHTH